MFHHVAEDLLSNSAVNSTQPCQHRMCSARHVSTVQVQDVCPLCRAKLPLSQQVLYGDAVTLAHRGDRTAAADPRRELFKEVQMIGRVQVGCECRA